MINIVKSQPAPPCLSDEKKKAQGNYKCEGVLKRLIEDFYNKCYLCEEKGLSSINVEHFKPHLGDKELKYDWNNLFLSCSHCNNTKSNKYDNILDCTDVNNTIIDLLKFEIEPFPKSKAIITALNSDDATVATAKLLNEIYNGTTELKSYEAANIMKKLKDEMKVFNDSILAYFTDDALSPEEKQIEKENIEKSLSPSSAFTAFKIWSVKNNNNLLDKLQEIEKL